MKPNLVRRARDIEPLLATHFVVADYFADARIENLRTSTGQGIDARVLQRDECIPDGKLGDARKITDLDHGKGFQVNARAA